MTHKNRHILLLVDSVLIIVALFNFASVDSVQATTAEFRAAAPSYSCMRPAAYETKVLCADLAADILAATVRIEMHTQYVSQEYSYIQVRTSHATIMGGRYLVTHNHFKFSLIETAARGEEGHLAISLRRADGTLILDQATLSSFQIVYADPQTLVLEFLNDQGSGLFSALGLPSADFAAGRAVQLQPGMELAQVDWDGEQAQVEWAPIEVLYLEATIPQLQMANFVRFGSSGGGVFWQGQHIGNNWARDLEENPLTGEVIRKYSIIALNSAAVVDLDFSR